MKNLLRIVKPVALVTLLAISGTGLALATQPASVSHAASAPTTAATTSNALTICYVCLTRTPTISAQYANVGGWTEGGITGSNFTGYSWVLVDTYSPSGVLLTQVWVYSDFWGRISEYNFSYPACQSYYTVRAYDSATGKWSNSATVYYINCLT